MYLSAENERLQVVLFCRSIFEKAIVVLLKASKRNIQQSSAQKVVLIMKNYVGDIRSRVAGKALFIY